MATGLRFCTMPGYGFTIGIDFTKKLYQAKEVKIVIELWAICMDFSLLDVSKDSGYYDLGGAEEFKGETLASFYTKCLLLS